MQRKRITLLQRQSAQFDVGGCSREQNHALARQLRGFKRAASQFAGTKVIIVYVVSRRGRGQATVRLDRHLSFNEQSRAALARFARARVEIRCAISAVKSMPLFSTHSLQLLHFFSLSRFLSRFFFVFRMVLKEYRDVYGVVLSTREITALQRLKPVKGIINPLHQSSHPPQTAGLEPFSLSQPYR